MKDKIYISKCGIVFDKIQKLGSHNRYCQICKESFLNEFNNWNKQCECGCGQITNFNKKRINGHGAKNYKWTEEHRYNNLLTWTTDRREKVSKNFLLNNPMKNPEISKKFKGDLNPAKRLEVREKISKNNSMKNPIYIQKHKEALSNPDVRKKISDRLRINNPSYNPDILAKRVDTFTTRLANGEYHSYSNRWKTGNFVKQNGETEWYDSSLELRQMEYYEKNGIEWTKKHKIRIIYINQNGKKSYYIPDFLIKVDDVIIIVELKGWLSDNTILKCNAAKQYCLEKNFKYHLIHNNNIIEELSLL